MAAPWEEIRLDRVDQVTTWFGVTDISIVIPA
jgi:hypothetical protein